MKTTVGLDADFLSSVVRQASYQCRADSSGFFLCNPELKRATLVATYNLTKIPWDEDLPRRVMASREAVVERQADNAVLLAVPLIWQDEVRGVLVVYDTDEDRIIRQRDRVLLQSLADMTASVALRNENLARMTNQFRALHDIDVALSSSLELDQVLNMILEKAIELVGAEHGSLRQLDPNTDKLILKACYGDGWTPRKRAYAPSIGQGIVRWVATHRKPYLCPDVRKDPQYVVLFEDMRSAVAVPLQYGHEDPSRPEAFLGVLLLESSRVSDFNQQDVELLEALAQEAVIAIQNATRHHQLRAEQEKRLAAEKWAVMGQAATALAHRINNLMGIVPVSAREIQRALSNVSVDRQDQEWIEANLSRIERNAKFILKLSDALFRPFKDSGPASRLDVNHLLNEALESADLPEEITIDKTLAADLPPVRSNMLLLDIFLELIVNARKAMESMPRPQLSLRTCLEESDGRQWVVAEIADTGRGISAEQREHLWKMFQHSDEGLGFGLWWLRTFIEHRGGTIDCASRLNEGATFKVKLPADLDQQGARYKPTGSMS